MAPAFAFKESSLTWTGVITRILQMVGSIAADEALTEEWADLLAYEEPKG